MQRFIPFEDDWDALEHLAPECLRPYRAGLPLLSTAQREAAQRQDAPRALATACFDHGSEVARTY
ncbi:hypothetical protein [Fulvimonas soli]|jgi:hypothetical protein|uniref:Uncharacterized protein n=1 Tax=Fulvimonas soli TaxID=155197 RepID=A0A316I0J3_9GAMM|nr:hypothetical protein [Fulvimonas soli]PWK86611.1 hypothetical protein C7456_1071 [Fulvimonas soli]TNY25540.1 hypothetical protein BV497_13310 [Fulvimonas soli]